MGTHYSKAPLTEAIIDIQVAENVDVELLAACQKVFVADYPTIHPIVQTELRTEFNEKESSAHAMSSRRGWRSTSRDELYVWQIQINSFTLSRLKPYEHWESFKAEARRLWTGFRDVVNPSRITRVGMRYINRIDVPLSMTDLSEYLQTVPEISSNLPHQKLSSFFMRAEIPQPDLPGVLLLTEASVPPAHADQISVALDIDVFMSENMPTTDDQLWDHNFERLRTRRNEVFEACITDKTRRLIE